MDACTELVRYPAAMLADAMDGRNILPPSISALVPVKAMVGPAYTVSLEPGDNLGLHHAVARAERGCVIVAASRGPNVYGVWGAILSSAARAAGLAGVVLDAYVRDLRELASAGPPIFGRGACLRKTVKSDPGRHGVAVRLGVVEVRAGDFVIGDMDGVVVVPVERVEPVLARAKEIEGHEAEILRGLQEGKTTIELLQLPSFPEPVDRGQPEMEA